MPHCKNVTPNVMQPHQVFSEYTVPGLSSISFFFFPLGNFGNKKYIPGEFLKYFLFLVILPLPPDLIQTRTFITTGEKYGIV